MENLTCFDKNNGRIIFRLDNKVCPKTRKIPKKEIMNNKEKWLQQNLPLDWIKAYSIFD